MRHKRTLTLGLLLFLVIASCGISAWFVVQPRADRFLMPGARDVAITEVGLGRRLITYQMANPQDGWLTSTGLRLRDEGWDPPTELYVWGSTEQYANIFTRHTRFWRVTFWEQARLDGDARNARITLRRWVEWR